MQRAPARPGDPLAAVETPALCVDLEAFERNLDRMAHATRGIRLRPHAKSHKTPEIARAQIARGAIGVCCQKTDEAAAFVEAGIRDVLVTNEVVGPAKVRRLADLARHATIGVLIDAPAVVPLLAQTARAAGVLLDAYVEIDVGAHRCGVAPGVPAAELAGAIAAAPGLRFKGVQAYHGPAQHLRTPAERNAAVEAAAAHVRATRAALAQARIACDIVTGAGTGTWPLEQHSGVYDELQPGSYVFMDADYARNTHAANDVRFEHSLFVLAAVMSAPAPDRIIVDAGLKALSFDSGLPLVVAVGGIPAAIAPAPVSPAPPVHRRDGLEYRKATDEHGIITIAPGARAPALDDRVWLVPGHCDPTVNLYDWLVAYRGARVEAVWQVAARGALG